MKKNSILSVVVLAVVFLFNNCKKNEKKSLQKEAVAKTTQTVTLQTLSCAKYLRKNKENNLNISILLDLSDRINNQKYPNLTMSYANRDLGYINAIAQNFINHVKHKKIIMMHEQMQVFFEPAPADVSINKKSQELKVVLDKNLKKSDLENTLTNYQKLPKEIYNLAMKSKEYIGSDTWRFFKDKVKNYCIEDCSRNILVILTDGYIYHSDTKLKENEKTSYITPETLRKMKLTKSNWKKIMDKRGYGFIPATKNLNDLEVLVLGIENHDKRRNPYGKDVITAYWEKWLTDMGVKRFEIQGADLPSNMQKIIQKFIEK